MSYPVFDEWERDGFRPQDAVFDVTWDVKRKEEREVEIRKWPWKVSKKKYYLDRHGIPTPIGWREVGYTSKGEAVFEPHCGNCHIDPLGGTWCTCGKPPVE
jgi:hypothetical protein